MKKLTWNSEKHDFLVGPLLGGIVGNGQTARGDVALLLGVGDVAIAGSAKLCNSATREMVMSESLDRGLADSREDDVGGEAVTGLEGGHCEGIDLDRFI